MAEVVHIPYDTVAAQIAVALAAGLLVGLEREWAHKEIGVRTFSIVALLGVLTSMVSPAFVLAGLAGVFLLVIFLNVQSLLKDQSLELTTSASLIVVMVLGTLSGMGHYFTTASAAIVMTGLLAWKSELSRFAGGLREQEIRGAVLLGLLGFVIYPLLPDRFVDPWRLFNPQEAWVIVIVIAGIGFVNYVLLRLYGQKGLYYAALLGGLVNSTAAAAELSANMSGQKAGRDRAVAVVLLTNVSMFARNLVILGIFATAAVGAAVTPLLAMALASLLIAWRMQVHSESGKQSLALSSPVSLGRVLKFAVIFVIIAAAGTLAQRQFGSTGFLVVSVIGGLVSSASTTAAAAALIASGQLSNDIAAMATILTSISSALVNLPIVYQNVQRGVMTRLFTATVGIIAVGLVALGVEWWVVMR